MSFALGVGVWVGAALLLGFAWALLAEINLRRARRKR